MRTKLRVNKKDYDEVESLGAKYEKRSDYWYIPKRLPIAPFEKFILLNIELVPQGNWYENLRSELPKELWDILRREQYKKAGYQCEICGEKGSAYFKGIGHPVECHEVWEYDDDETKVQRLVGLIALCHDCHRAKHRGKANIDGVGDVIDKHIAKVNQWDLERVEQYVEESFDVWEERSQYKWILDLSKLKEL